MKSARISAVLLTLFALSVYLLTLAPDMLPGDSGEFQFAAPRLTIVHPTGYPFYLLLAKLFTFIPIGTIAYRVNLFSAASAALAVGMFYVVALMLDEGRTTKDDSYSSFVLRRSSALVAALTLAFSPTFWSQATEAEVYALNSLFIIALIGLSFYIRHTQGRRAAWLWFAFTLGLSLTHHRSILLLLPALVIWLYPFAGLRRVWLPALLLALLPLALYLYTPLRYDATPYTQIRLDDQHIITTLAESPAAFVAHALGVGFRGALRWDALTVERLWATPERITANFTLLGRVLLSLGMLWLLWRREWRRAAFFIISSWMYFLFNALYQIGDIEDFFTPVYIVGAWLMAYGVVALGRWHIALALMAWLIPAWLLWTNFAPLAQHPDPRAQWQQLLADDPASGAILISNDRDEMTPLYYLQLVEGVRPDLIPLFPLISPDFPHVVPLTAYALETSRPVYFIKAMDSLSVKFRLQPQGQLVRVVGLQETQPDHVLVRESAWLKLIGWSRADDGQQMTGDGKQMLGVILFWQAQGQSRPDLKTYVHVLDRDGKKIAQDDHTPGDVFYPPSQWTAGETLYDAHLIILPSNLSRGEYQLIAGAYLPDGRALDGVGHIALGQLRLVE